MNFKTCLAVCMCLLTLSCDDTIDPDTSGKFMKFYGGAHAEKAYAVEQLSDGGFMIVGSTESFGQGGKEVFVIGTDANGNRKWQKFYGSTSDDEAKSIQAASDGSCFILGYTTKDTFKDFYLLKINQQGDTIFTRSFGNAKRHEEGVYLQTTLDGGLALIGKAIDTLDNSTDVYLIKTNLTGEEPLYQRLYGLPERTDTVGSILEAGNGDLVWCGTFVRDKPVSSMRIVKSDAFGNLKWDFPFNTITLNKNASGINIQRVSDNGYIAVGTIETEESTDIYLVRITENGQKLWDIQLNDPDNTNANETGAYVYPTRDGGFIITGSTARSETDSDILLMKVDGQGNAQWAKPQLFGGAGYDTGSFVKETADGGYILLGTVDINNDTAISLIKTDANGQISGK